MKSLYFSFISTCCLIHFYMLIIHFYVLIIPTDLELSDAVIIAQLSLHGCSIATCISDERSIQRHLRIDLFRD
jgi:hypothetical protein